MTGRSFHRTMEMIPRPPLVILKPFKKDRILGIFSVFGGILLGFQNFSPRGLFAGFFMEVSGSGHLGGRGVLKTRSRKETLNKENLVRPKTVPTVIWRHHTVTKGNKFSPVPIHFPQPERHGKSSDVGARGRMAILTNVGHTPSTAGTFRKKFRKNLERPRKRSHSRVRLGSPKPYNSRHLRLPEHFQNSLPLGVAGDASFFRSSSGKGLSELLSWNSQQY